MNYAECEIKKQMDWIDVKEKIPSPYVVVLIMGFQCYDTEADPYFSTAYIEPKTGWVMAHEMLNSSVSIAAVEYWIPILDLEGNSHKIWKE